MKIELLKRRKDSQEVYEMDAGHWAKKIAKENYWGSWMNKLRGLGEKLEFERWLERESL